MVLAIDISDGRGLSNDAHCELLLKESKVIAKVGNKLLKHSITVYYAFYQNVLVLSKISAC